MRLLPRITFLRLLLSGCLAVAALMTRSWWREKQRREHPDAAFLALTGHALPGGVVANGYTSDMNDALFRTTSYWLLSGPREKLLALTQDHGLVQTEGFARNDARQFQQIFGIVDSKAKVTDCFSWRDDDSPGPILMAFYYVLDDGTAYFVKW